MIIDSSAVMAIFNEEPDKDYFEDKLINAGAVWISTATILELEIVTRDPQRLQAFLSAAKINPLAFDMEHLRWARHAVQHYARGSGSPAKLNYGDCFAYAASKATGEPLLYKGEDFALTDVDVA